MRSVIPIPLHRNFPWHIFLPFRPFKLPSMRGAGGVLSIRSVIPIPLHRNIPWHIFLPFRRSAPLSERGRGCVIYPFCYSNPPSPKYSLAYFLTVPPLRSPLREGPGVCYLSVLSSQSPFTEIFPGIFSYRSAAPLPSTRGARVYPLHSANLIKLPLLLFQ